MHPTSFIRVPPVSFSWADKPMTIDSFEISIRPVTISEFRYFVQETGYVPTQGRNGFGDTFESNDLLTGVRVAERESLPAVYVSWTDASAYCAWAHLRLPSEEEWFAARYKDEDLLDEACSEWTPFEFTLWEWTATLIEANRAILRHSPTQYFYKNQQDRYFSRRKLVDLENSNINWAFSVIR
jgi:formylglycine-generating enzyme required for sulfatase activity